MPSLVNAIPKYRKHKSSGQAIVAIGGVEHYLGPHGTKASRLEYDRIVGEWITAGRPSSIAKAPDLTIAELCQRYKKHAESYYSKGGFTHNIATALRTLHLRYGGTLARIRTPGIELTAVQSRLAYLHQERCRLEAQRDSLVRQQLDTDGAHDRRFVPVR